MTDPMSHVRGLTADHLRIRYDGGLSPIIADETVRIAHGKITVLIGPNGSGKSTLLKGLARQLPLEAGTVLLDGQDIARMPNRAFARTLGILFQENVAPADITIEELIYHGRYPHRRLFEGLAVEDSTAVEDALRLADLTAMRHRSVSQLSAGQRQLAWIAMILAQGPDYLFLDEPTTFLDLAHQFDVMDLIRRLNREHGRTIVLVLHDLNLAAQYADVLCAMRDGHVIASGIPDQVLTVETLRRVFDIETRILRDDSGRSVFCIPIRKATS
jgi:iron complex transport system ATP-binding protein